MGSAIYFTPCLCFFLVCGVIFHAIYLALLRVFFVPPLTTCVHTCFTVCA
jgi:hypothetical protein